MCLYIDKEKHPNYKSIILEKDKVVYKLLECTNNRYSTPYKNMSVIFNCLYTSNIERYTSSWGYSEFLIEKGLHSFVNMIDPTILKANSKYMKIFKAIIPKGSEVYYGTNDDIVSNQLIITDEEVCA